MWAALSAHQDVLTNVLPLQAQDISDSKTICLLNTELYNRETMKNDKGNMYHYALFHKGSHL